MLLGKLMGHSAVSPAGIVTVSGEIVSSVWTDEVGIRFNTDGTVDQLIGATYTQIDVTTDWIIPNGDASTLYEVMTNNWVDIGGAGDGFENAAAAEGIWVPFTFGRLWSVKGVAAGGADSNAMQFDAHIRYNGGAILDSGPFEITSEGE